MFNKKTVDIAILGAGPAGLTAAHTLADKGMDFVLLDKEDKSHLNHQTIALHPETLELLDAINVVIPVLSQSTHLNRACLYDSHQKQRAVIDYSELTVKFPFIAVIDQDKLETILIDALKEKGYKPKWHHRARCIEQSDTNVAFTVDRLTEGMTGYAVAHMEMEIDKIFDYKANYVIAADGNHSLAREAAGIDYPEITRDLHYAVFELTTETSLPMEMRMIIEGDHTHAYWPMGPRRCRFSFQMNSESSDQDRGGSSPDLENTHLMALLKAHAPWFKAPIHDVTSRKLVHYQTHLADCFGNNRIWLAGDSAHMTPPTGMLSVNIGMHEAADLANRLSTAPNDDVRQFRLHAYNADRTGEWRRLLDIDHHIVGDDSTAKWLLRHRNNIIGNLPASGESLSAILKQLHLTDAA
ncbi:MAG TPA: hypothetical protein DCX06_03385 [Opitutae bacterium]|nr:hypothetical protein [Opitutae bacterium]